MVIVCFEIVLVSLSLCLLMCVGVTHQRSSSSFTNAADTDQPVVTSVGQVRHLQTFRAMFDRDWMHSSEQTLKLWKAQTVKIGSKCAFGRFRDMSSFQSALTKHSSQKKGRWNPLRQSSMGDKQSVLKPLVTDLRGE